MHLQKIETSYTTHSYDLSEVNFTFAMNDDELRKLENIRSAVGFATVSFYRVEDELINMMLKQRGIDYTIDELKKALPECQI